MANVVGGGGVEGYPSLEDICLLFRSLINDTFSSGAGQIATDTAPWMLPFLNSAIRDLYSDLRMSGDMSVVVDNYILIGLTPVFTQDPSVQTSLGYNGYYNGTTWNGNFSLPADLMWVLKLWQRQSGTADYFFPMHEAAAGLQGVAQGDLFGEYEVRGGAIWFNGAIYPIDLRIRYKAGFPDIVGGNINFSTTYIPIQDSTNAIAHKMVADYAQRLSPDQFQTADGRAKEFTNKLKAEIVLANQTKEYQRQLYGR